MKMLQTNHYKPTYNLLGPVPVGTGTIALDPTFGSFTLLDPVSLVSSNLFLW
jgi:hypothetical protein